MGGTATFKMSEADLRRKLSHIVGFTLDEDLDVETLLDILKGQDALDLVNEVQRAIESSKSVKTQSDLSKFFTKDVSQIQDNRGEGTIYAIDLENAPEVNYIDKIF